MGTPGTAAAARSGGSTNSLRFRQRMLANNGASPTKGLSSPKKRLDFDKFESSPSTSSRGARHEGSPTLVKRTPLRKPDLEERGCTPVSGPANADSSDDDDDARSQEIVMNTPRSHSRKTKVHFHRGQPHSLRSRSARAAAGRRRPHR